MPSCPLEPRLPVSPFSPVAPVAQGLKKSPWIKWVADYAHKNNMNYFTALSHPEVSKFKQCLMHLSFRMRTVCRVLTTSVRVVVKADQGSGVRDGNSSRPSSKAMHSSSDSLEDT